MRIYDQDFRYLLLHLVPQHRLPPAVRRDVETALRTGDTGDLRRESIRALEALCATAYFIRTNVSSDNGSVVVGYRKTGGRYRVSVAVPREEWTRWGRVPDAHPGVERVVSRPAAATVSTPQEESDVGAPTRELEPADVLPDIIRSFAIADRSSPVLDRLEILLGTLERWLGFQATGLEIVEDSLLPGDATGDRVRLISDAELRASEPARKAIESGARRLIPKAHLTADGDGVATWEVMGLVPIFAAGNVIGILRVYFAPGLDRPTMEGRLDLAAGVVRQVIEFNEQFENLTSIDSLTGVYNRQFFDRQLPVEIERATRSGASLSMLVIDIDDFKRVNDELGHKKGDEALVAVADIIRRNLRKVDIAFRYGGEEFVILLPGTPEFEAVHTAERLRRVIQQHRGFRDPRGNPREVTVSVGVSVYPDTARTDEMLFTQADEAMYRAKQRGKNQVVLFSNA
jgi:diguanylate cyclase (GGDEF)-like protein